jgi:tagatose 6-phosphate kinase
MLLTVGLTPAWQQLVLLSRLRPGEVNRARQVRWCAAGKSIDVAFAARALGAEDVCALTLLGGAHGARIAGELKAAGIGAEAIEVSAETRVCTTILADGGVATELVQPAEAAPAEAVDALCARAAELVSAAEVVVLSGSLPAACRRDVFAQIARSVADAGVPLVADIRGEELQELLTVAAPRPADAAPWVLKPNRAELASTLGKPLGSAAELEAGIVELLGGAALSALISDGASPAWLSGPAQAAPSKLEPPAVDLVNPIGAGDALAAGVALALARGSSPSEAAWWGLCSAGASCETWWPGRLVAARVEQLHASLAAAD